MEAEYQIKINKEDAYYTDEIVKKSIESKIYKLSDLEDLRLRKDGTWYGQIGLYFFHSLQRIEVW